MSSFPAALARPQNRLRQSFAARFDKCPHSAMLSEAHPARTHQLNRGGVLHDFASRVTARCIATGSPTFNPSEGRELMLALITQSDEPIDAAEHDTLMLLAWQFCATHTFDVDDILDLEAEYNLRLDVDVQVTPGKPRERFEVWLTGRPDLMVHKPPELIVHDYKTQWGVDPESAIGGTFQGRFYAALGFDAFDDVERVRMLWDYVRWGEDGIRDAVIERWQYDRLIEYLRGVAGRVIRARHRDRWPALPGSWCGTCPAVEECPLPERDRRKAPPIDRAMAQSYANQLQALKAFVDLRQKQVRQWIVDHGPLDVGDGRYQLELGQPTRKVDKAARDRMTGAGVDVERFESVVKGSTTFRFRKREEAS